MATRFDLFCREFRMGVFIFLLWYIFTPVSTFVPDCLSTEVYGAGHCLSLEKIDEKVDTF